MPSEAELRKAGTQILRKENFLRPTALLRPGTLSFQEAETLHASIPQKALGETELFVAGDHWQNGDGWTGWRPVTNDPYAQQQYTYVQNLFNPKNVIGGMVKRLRGATLGKEPDWEIVARRTSSEARQPVDGELPQKDKKFADLDDELVRWWTNKKIHRVLKQFITNKASYGKASLRIYIPSAFLDANGKLKSGSDLRSALNAINVEAPHFSRLMDAVDPDFGREFTVLKLDKLNDSEPDRYEVCYIDDQGNTAIRIVSSAQTAPNSNNAVTANEIKADLKGSSLTYVEGEFRDAIISETIKAQQRSVNHAKTGENFALANINFPETTFINANLPMEKTTDNAGKLVETPAPLKQGLGGWRNIVGLLTQRADGTEELHEPKIVYREGADPMKFAKVADNNCRDMHQEAGMLYIYLADSEYASGESKIESMTDYLILLVDHKTTLDTAGVWMLNGVLRLAMYLSNKTGDMEDFDVIFSTKITLGRVSNEDKKQWLDEVNAGLRSRRNYMVAAEVADDPNSELTIVRADQQDKLKTDVEKQKQLQAVMPQPTNGNGKPAPAGS